MRYLLVLVFLFLTSCQTGGIVLRETPLGISETRKAVVSVIGEPRRVSQNGRELYSQYYGRDGKNISDPLSVRQRLSTRVIILGDRRPYDIQVTVFIEEKTSGRKFEITGQDDGRAAQIAENLRKRLNQSRDSRNVIDDFRSF